MTKQKSIKSFKKAPSPTHIPTRIARDISSIRNLKQNQNLVEKSKRSYLFLGILVLIFILLDTVVLFRVSTLAAIITGVCGLLIIMYLFWRKVKNDYLSIVLSLLFGITSIVINNIGLKYNIRESIGTSSSHITYTGETSYDTPNLIDTLLVENGPFQLISNAVAENDNKGVQAALKAIASSDYADVTGIKAQAQAYYLIGEYEPSLSCVYKALPLANENQLSTLFFMMARCYLMLGDNENALASIDSAINYDTLKENQIQLYSLKSDCLSGWSKHEYEDKVLSFSPKYANDCFLQGIIYEDRSQMKAARAKYSDSIDIEPNAEAYHARGRILYKQGKTKKALVDFKKAEELEPTRNHVMYSTGLAWLALKEYDKAIYYFSRAIEIDSLDLRARFMKCLTSNISGNFVDISESLADLAFIEEHDSTYIDIPYLRYNAFIKGAIHYTTFDDDASDEYDRWINNIYEKAIFSDYPYFNNWWDDCSKNNMKQVIKLYSKYFEKSKYLLQPFQLPYIYRGLANYHHLFNNRRARKDFSKVIRYTVKSK